MFIFVVHSDHKTLMVNPNCCIKLITNYIRINLKIHPKREFDLTNSNGDLVEIGQLEMGESGLLLLKPRDVYFVVTYTRNQFTGKRIDYRPLLDENSPHYKLIKERTSSKLNKSKTRMAKSFSLTGGDPDKMKKRPTMETFRMPSRTHSLPELTGMNTYNYALPGPRDLIPMINTINENKEKLVGSFETDLRKQVFQAKALSNKIKKQEEVWYPKPLMRSFTIDELMKDFSGKLLVSEDGYFVDRNGYLRDAEGKLVRREGCYVDKNGLLRTEDGDLLVRDGLNVNKDGNQVTKDGYAVSKDGMLFCKNGDRLQVNGYFVNKDGMLITENGEFVSSSDGVHFLDKDGLLRESNGNFVMTYQGFNVNKYGFLADVGGQSLKTSDNFYVDKNGYLYDDNKESVRDAYGRQRKIIPSQLADLIFDKDSTGKYITTPDECFVDKKGFLRDKEGNFVLNKDGYRINKEGHIVHNDGKPIKKMGYFVTKHGLLVGNDGSLVRKFSYAVDYNGFLRTEEGELITVDDYIINENGLLCTTDGKLVNQDGKVINKENLLVEPDGTLYRKHGHFVNRHGLLCSEAGTPIIRHNHCVNENGVLCETDGTPVKKSEHFVNKEGLLCNSEGALVPVGDLYLNKDGLLSDERGKLATSSGHFLNKEGLLCDNNGQLLTSGSYFVNSKDVLCNRAGEPMNLGGTYLNKNGQHCDKNGKVEVIDNKYLPIGHDTHLKDSDVHHVKIEELFTDKSLLNEANGETTNDEYSIEKDLSLRDEEGNLFKDEIKSLLYVAKGKDVLLRDKNGKCIKKHGHYIGKDLMLYDNDGNILLKDGYPVDCNNLLRNRNGQLLERNGRYVDALGNTVEKRQVERLPVQQTLVFKERRKISGAPLLFQPGTKLEIKEEKAFFTMGNANNRKCHFLEQDFLKRKQALRLGVCHNYDIVHGSGPPNKKWWTPAGQLMTTRRSTEKTRSYAVIKIAKTLTKGTQTDICYPMRTLIDIKEEAENYHKQFDNLIPKT